jgi:peptide/nickel transport system permease protein
VLTLAATLLGLLGITFVIGRVIPIDPVLAIIGERATAEQYAAAREALGLDAPIWTQFAIYVRDAATGDFGRSLLSGQPVIEDIARVFPATLELATIATLIGVALGVPAGVLAATRPGGILDQVVRVVGLIGYSMPVFWLGLMGLLIFYGKLQWVGGPGRLDTSYEFLFELDVPQRTGSILIDSALAGAWDILGNALTHIVLPATVLGYYSMAYISRMTRSFMLEQLSQDYVTTARVKGMPEWRVVWVHALRNVACRSSPWWRSLTPICSKDRC